MTSESPTVPEAGVIAGPGVPRFELTPHNCFACGTLNAHGLRLRLHVEPGRAWTDGALDPRFEGWEGIAHGGIICTILDEVMAWALVGSDNWGLTARLSVDFRKPVEVGRGFRAEGWVTSSRKRLVETAGRIVDSGTGADLARAEGVYLAAGADRKNQLRERYGFRFLDSDGIDTPAPVARALNEPIRRPAR